MRRYLVLPGLIIFCLLIGFVGFAQPVPSGDSAATAGMSALGRTPRVILDSSRTLITDTAGRVIGLIDKAGNIQLLPAPAPGRFGWLYNVAAAFLIVGLVCLAFIIIAATYKYIFKKNAEARQGNNDSWKYNITKIISLVLLASFVLGLIALFFVNLEVDSSSQVNEKWFEIFKNLLLLLGTSFTTIMGYFFGQAQAANIEKAKDKLENENKVLNEVGAGLTRQIEAIIPNQETVIRQQQPASSIPASPAAVNDEGNAADDDDKAAETESPNPDSPIQ